MKKSSLRWVPAIAIPAVVIAGAVAVPTMANAAVTLPHKSAAGIVAFAQKSDTKSFSGSITETANLGLPDLSSLGSLGGSSSSSSSIESTLSQLTGTHKAKLYVDGASKQRVQTLDNLKETDVIRNGSSVWTYDSDKKTASHITLPSKSSTLDTGVGATPTPGATPLTPTEAAQKALTAIGKYTTVKVSDNVKVAGQKAYQITLKPKDDSTTLVGSVTLAVDGQTGVPLRVVVKAKGQTAPALSVAFTSISYSTPSASTFTFTPPAGTKVKQIKTPAASGHRMHPGALTQNGSVDRAKEHAKPVVVGSGWSTIVSATLPSGALSGNSAGMLDKVLTKVSGGEVLQTALVSVYLTDDGHVYVGAVTASALEAAAAAQK